MAKSILVKRPVAFRVQRANDDGVTLSKTEWRYFTDEAEAARESDALCADCQALYVRDGTAIVAEWEPIGSAPTSGTFLVCAVGDKPFVVSGQVLWAARKGRIDSHLALFYVTHWMPLPVPPPLSVGENAHKSPCADGCDIIPGETCDICGKTWVIAVGDVMSPAVKRAKDFFWQKAEQYDREKLQAAYNDLLALQDQTDQVPLKQALDAVGLALTSLAGREA